MIQWLRDRSQAKKEDEYARGFAMVMVRMLAYKENDFDISVDAWSPREDGIKAALRLIKMLPEDALKEHFSE